MDSAETMCTAEVARYLSVSRRTIYRWVKTGRIEGIRRGRSLEIATKGLEALRTRQAAARDAVPTERPNPLESQPSSEAVTPCTCASESAPSDLARAMFLGAQRDVTFYWRNF